MKKKIYLIILISFLSVFLVTLFINIYMVTTTSNKIINLDDLYIRDNYDAILVLGCKVYGDAPSLMLEKRLDKGIEVYKKLNTKIIVSGDHSMDNYDEINVMKNYLLSQDIPSKDIFQDHAGISTYDSIYRLKYIFDANKVIIVTQKYHMFRALYIADKLGVDAVGIVADDVPYKSIMIKNEIREVLSRDKNFIKVMIKPQSKYLGEKISLHDDGNITNG